MKQVVTLWIAVLLASLVASGAWAQSNAGATGGKAAADDSPSAATAAGSAKETTGAKGSAAPLINGPEVNFRAARAAFSKKNFGTSAEDIQKGAALIRAEANQPASPNQTDLLAAAADLDTVAGNVAQGNTSAPYEMSRAFARADLELARHYHMMAESALKQQDTKQASAYLGTAGDYVKDSVAWNSQQLKESGSPIVKKMRALQKSLQEKVASGAHAASQETAKGLDALGKDLQQLSQRMSQ